MLGWTRLLSVRFAGPMVGREVLLGIGGGLASHEVFWLSAAVLRWFGHSSAYFVKEVSLTPIPQFVADQLISHVESIEIPIGTIFVFLLGRRAFGVLGGTIAYLLILPAYAYVSVGIVLYILLLLVAVLRSGLLTGVALH